MARTYAEMEHDLDAAQQTIVGNRAILDRVLQQSGQAVTNLATAISVNAGLAGEINTFLTNNPNNDAAKTLKARKDLLVTEFTALNTTAEAVLAAIQAQWSE